VTVAATQSTAMEAGPLPGTFTITRTGSTAAPLIVFYTMGGTATPAADYVDPGTSVAIPAGASQATVTVAPVADAMVEGDETVVLAILPSDSYLVGAPDLATVVIRDGDGWIFSNFGDMDTRQVPGGAMCAGNPQASCGAGVTRIDLGFGFTPTGGEYRLRRIELAIGLVDGPNELDVWLMEDQAGKPGAPIEAFRFSNAMGPFGVDDPLLAAESVQQPILKAGTRYWLVASLPFADAMAGWHDNSIGDAGPRAHRINGGDWQISTQTRGAFRVVGAPAASSPMFTDVAPAHWARAWIEAMYSAGLTGGCSVAPPAYCPEQPVTRAQMAVFLLRARHGPGFTPPPPRGQFADVPPGHWAAAWIEQLAAEGITSGCGAGVYCPEDPVTRAQMAVFLLRASDGPAVTPSPARGQFADVPPGHWAAAWIEQLAAEGITSGCGAGIYCPEDPVTRAQMAVFIMRAFGLL
jgi:hypothetical protein